MKPLKPSMRENKRYILVKGNNPEENIKKSILESIGVFGMAKTGLSFISKGKDSAIISVNREMLNSVRACFSVYKNKLVAEKVSGTLKGLKAKN